jgi:2-polyprenyl-3-methyl-5-hydroxy-6-metoxy-1,4-benzoquinol methylase
MNQKLKYLFRSASRFFMAPVCTNCGSTKVAVTDQKYIVTRLYECKECFLQFRHPSDNQKFNEDFYQEDYTQNDGITTDLPTGEELRGLLSSDFANSPKNVKGIVELWQTLLGDLSKIKAVDYGCSWGYMSYQFKNRGIQVQSFEISKPRAMYGNKNLGLAIKSDVKDLNSDNDIVYSSHVIEHVPSISEMVNESRRLLKKDGLFVAESPNGSLAFRKEDPTGFHRSWGLVHPNYLSDKFYQQTFIKNPYFITSTPYDLATIREWDKNSQVTHNTGGGQLMIIAKPNLIL